ncbi:hypothetical protein BSKO_03585 [Bryopsis sp. KO-2023]|nr:hypothetical protein BSKO_03585 [Bryopsis sp. KO-2023]
MASPGKTIIAEGCRGEHMFVVYSGVCYAFKDASSTKEVLGRSRSDPSTAIEAVGGSFAPLGGGVRSMSQDCSTSMHQIETITNGECFGDTAILNRDCRYSTTVVAAVNVELLVLDLGSIRQVFGAIDTTRLPWLSEKYRPSLKRLPRERTEEDVAKLTDLICEVLYEGYPENEVIMEQGGVGTSFFVLLSGECDVRIRAQHDSIEDHKEHDEEREAASQENRRQDDQTQETEGNSDLAPQQPPRNIARRRGIMAPAHSLDALQMPLVDENEANMDMATPQDGDPGEPDIAPQVAALRQIHMDLMKEAAGAKESPKAKQLLTHASNALLDTEDYSNLIWGDDTEEVDSIRQKLEHKYGSVVQEMQSGATFGEVALLTKGSVRLASVVSKTPVDLMIIEKRDYDSILKALQQREIEELVHLGESCSWIYFDVYEVSDASCDSG